MSFIVFQKYKLLCFPTLQIHEESAEDLAPTAPEIEAEPKVEAEPLTFSPEAVEASDAGGIPLAAIAVRDDEQE